MPRVTQYIRNEDFDKWNALENKSEFIHGALNSGREVDRKINIPKYVMKALPDSDPECPRHHVRMSICYYKH